MGEIDKREKQLFSRESNAAELINNLLLSDVVTDINIGSELIVKPSELSEAGEIFQFENSEKDVAEIIRDVIKIWDCKYGDDNFEVIIGFENQTREHSMMPIRVLNYIAKSYYEQYMKKTVYDKNCGRIRSLQNIATKRELTDIESEELKQLQDLYKDPSKPFRIKPVITVVLYFGKKTRREWKAARKLSECIYMPEGLKVSDIFGDFFFDFEMKVINITNLSEEVRNKFSPAMKTVFMMHDFETAYGKIRSIDDKKLIQTFYEDIALKGLPETEEGRRILQEDINVVGNLLDAVNNDNDYSKILLEHYESLLNGGIDMYSSYNEIKKFADNESRRADSESKRADSEREKFDDAMGVMLKSAIDLANKTGNYRSFFEMLQKSFMQIYKDDYPSEFTYEKFISMCEEDKSDISSDNNAVDEYNINYTDAIQFNKKKV